MPCMEIKTKPKQQRSRELSLSSAQEKRVEELFSHRATLSIRHDCAILAAGRIKQGLALAVPLEQHAVYFYMLLFIFYFYVKA